VAVGRADPLPGKSPELHAIDPRLHLFVFADGGGKRIGPKLASTIAVDEIVDAFDKDDGPGSASDANLTAQARRLRLAVLSANRALLQQARGVGYAGLGTNVFAAHFSPSNDQVVVAHVGAHRAYRVRGGSITRLTTAQGGRLLGVSDKVDVEVVTEAVHPADVYLFCAERLGRGLGDDELLALLNGAEPSIEKVARALVDASGSKDLVEEDVGQDRVAVVVRVDAAPPGSAQSSRRAKTVIGLG
jgi:serine/threonine protein phosphatase PrpC